MGQLLPCLEGCPSICWACKVALGWVPAVWMFSVTEWNLGHRNTSYGRGRKEGGDEKVGHKERLSASGRPESESASFARERVILSCPTNSLGSSTLRCGFLKPSLRRYKVKIEIPTSRGQTGSYGKAHSILHSLLHGGYCECFKQIVWSSHGVHFEEWWGREHWQVSIPLLCTGECSTGVKHCPEKQILWGCNWHFVLMPGTMKKIFFSFNA